MKHHTRLAMTVAVGLSLITAGAALAAPKPKEGGFNTAASKKAWPHIERAMNLPMAELAEKATELKPEYVLSYGLALELGREPVTLNAVQRGRVQAVFQDFLNIYVRKKDGIRLEGTEEALLNQPDFWILMARSLARRETQRFISAGSTLSTDGGYTAGGALNITMFEGVNTAGNQDYNLYGDAVLNRYMVFASQSCLIYAKITHQMQLVSQIDAAKAPHLTPAQYKETQDKAQAVRKDALKLGPQACGSRDYFNKVLVTAQIYPGRLSSLTTEERLMPDGAASQN